MLTPREEKFLKTYETQLQKPKWKFVLTYGLSWAFFTCLFTAVVAILFDFGEPFWSSGKSIAIAVVIWAAAGVAYGLWLRSLLLKQYRKIKSKAVS